MTQAAPFTPWPGGEHPPVDRETKVVMKLRNGWTTEVWPAGKFIWRNRNQPGDVVGWRLA